MTPTLYKLKTKEFGIYINKDSERHEVFGAKEFKKATVTTVRCEPSQGACSVCGLMATGKESLCSSPVTSRWGFLFFNGKGS